MHPLHFIPLLADEVADSTDVNRINALFSGNWPASNVPPCDKQELLSRLLAGGLPDALFAGRELPPFGDNLWAIPLSIWWAA